jgi:hypothetical protein
MLFPTRPPAAYRRLAERWAAAVGGEVNPRPHVTIAYLVGYTDGDAVVDALGRVPLGAIRVELSGALSYSAVPHPLFGYHASLRVVKTPALGAAHEAVVAAVRPLGLASLYRWSDVDPHLQVLRHVPSPPSAFLPRLAALDPRGRFLAARLVVSRPSPDGTFPVVLDRRLSPGAPA